MRVSHRGRRTLPILLALAIGCAGAFGMLAGTVAQSETIVEIYASGLINPKGMAFADDGTLYVAESGAPGDVMVPLPVNFGGEGPIGNNARVSKIAPGGEREDAITGLPNIGLYGGVEMLGAGSVTNLDGQLYEVAAGHMTISPELSRINLEDELEPIADIGAFNKENPPPPSNGDAVPLGNPYDLVNAGGDLYITDGNFNRVLKVTPEGEISIFAAWEASPVTVGATVGPDGSVYVSQFSPAPYTPGSARIDKIDLDGTITEGVVTNLTTPIDVAFAPDGTMYVLQYAAEFSAEQLRYIAFGGEVQRVLPDGTHEPVVTNLVFPSAMEFGPDGALYVANYGNEANEGQGQILRVVPGDTTVEGPDVPAPDETGTYANVQPTVPPPAGVEPVGEITFVEPQAAMQWGYDPATITIETGQALTFTNAGRIAHTATANNGSFDTGSLPGGQSATIQFDNPGEFAYFCQPHPWMLGTVIVEGEPVGDTAAPAALADEPDPPSISFARAALFSGVLITLVFGAAYAMRRKDHTVVEEPTMPAADGPGD
ncbi:MAG TPA: ScyD/ScyE family protein [Thermomicrobiales bacterium]|nr:ScyD/ScyE family protein [Thermomicrobiales bacterium]